MNVLNQRARWPRMLDGVVRFPAEFAARYRAQGYWEDLSLRDTFDEVFTRYADRIAIIDREKSVTYAGSNERATRLAINLLDEGLEATRPGGCAAAECRRVCLPLFCTAKARLHSDHGIADTSLSRDEPVRRTPGAAACVTPDRAKDVDYCEMVRRIRGANRSLKFRTVLGDAPQGFVSLTELIERPNKHSANDSRKSASIRRIPRCFNCRVAPPAFPS